MRWYQRTSQLPGAHQWWRHQFQKEKHNRSRVAFHSKFNYQTNSWYLPLTMGVDDFSHFQRHIHRSFAKWSTGKLSTSIDWMYLHCQLKLIDIMIKKWKKEKDSDSTMHPDDLDFIFVHPKSLISSVFVQFLCRKKVNLFVTQSA